jgi:hypothetical protein
LKKVILNLVKNENGNYHTVFKTRHARKIYLAFSVSGDLCAVTECRYLDRSIIKIPKAITFAPFAIETLGEKISNELDATFSEIRFSEKEMMTEEALITRFLGKEKKKILLMLRDGETLRTVFRNKTHRSIYLELRLDHGQALIFDCHYADERSQGVPYGLTTIRFSFSLQELLHVVNDEYSLKRNACHSEHRSFRKGFSDFYIGNLHIFFSFVKFLRKLTL